MVSKKSKEDALLLSLESAIDSWVLNFGASFHATPHRSKGILGLFIWGIMNPIKFLEREKLRLSCRMGIIGYYMR